MYYKLLLDNKSKVLEVSDGNVSYSFPVNTYSINNLKPLVHNGVSEDITEILNKFAANQPAGDVMAVLQSADTYFQFRFNNVNLVRDVKSLTTSLTQTAMMDPNNVRNWVLNNVRVPNSFNETYVPNPNHTREHTYLKSDYVDAVCLAIYMKLLLPILAGYMSCLVDVYDKHAHEMECLKILPDTVKKLPGYIMLYNYTDTFSDSKAINHDLLLKREVPTEHRTEWLFSVLLIKRIISGTVYNNGNSQTLVSYIYRQIKNKTDGSATSFNYKDKYVGSSADDPDSSVLDKFRYKDKMSVAVQVMLIYAAEDEQLLPVVGDVIDHAEYRSNCVKFIHMLPEPGSLQLNICKMVLMPYIPHHVLWLIPHAELLKKLMLCHMILRDKHPLIAVMVIAYKGSDSSALYLRKNKLHGEELDRVYPYKKGKGNGKKTGITMARTALENMCKQMVGYKATLPAGSAKLEEHLDDEDVIVPSNVRQIVTDFYLDIDTLTTPLGTTT